MSRYNKLLDDAEKNTSESGHVKIPIRKVEVLFSCMFSIFRRRKEGPKLRNYLNGSLKKVLVDPCFADAKPQDFLTLI